MACWEAKSQVTITARYNFFVCLSIGAKCCLLKRSQQKLILEKAYSVPLVHCISIPNRLDNSTAHLTLGFPWIEEVSLEQVIHNLTQRTSCTYETRQRSEPIGMGVLISLDRSAQAHRVASPSPATHSIDNHLLGEGAPDFNKNSIEIQHNHINLSLKSGAPFVGQCVQGGSFHQNAGTAPRKPG